MGIKKLDIEINDSLNDRFQREVTEPGGLWRSKNKKETAYGALQSALEVALTEFLDSRKGKGTTR